MPRPERAGQRSPRASAVRRAGSTERASGRFAASGTGARLWARAMPSVVKSEGLSCQLERDNCSWRVAFHPRRRPPGSGAGVGPTRRVPAAAATHIASRARLRPEMVPGGPSPVQDVHRLGAGPDTQLHRPNGPTPLSDRVPSSASLRSDRASPSRPDSRVAIHAEDGGKTWTPWTIEPANPPKTEVAPLETHQARFCSWDRSPLATR